MCYGLGLVIPRGYGVCNPSYTRGTRLSHVPAVPTARRIEMWDLDRLIPYQRNARTHSPEQIQQIATSIQEFGFTNPILVDSADGIIAGHGRMAAARSIGMAEVPVIVLDHLTPTQRRAYVLADNQLALNSGWDIERLQEEVMSLNLADFDLGLIGFDADQITGLLDPDGIDDGGKSESGPDDESGGGMALAIVLSAIQMAAWRRVKERTGCSTDKGAFLKLIEGARV